VLGERAGPVVAVIALITTTNTTLLCLTAASRVLYGMASAGSLPPLFARVAPRTGAPDVAILVSAACAAAVALGRDLTLAASVTDAAVYATFLAVNAAVVLLRVRRPDLPRPLPQPCYGGRGAAAPDTGHRGGRLAASGLAVAGAARGRGSRGYWPPRLRGAEP
jgi:APA family basic amino acid/polyamine antiporter